MADHVVTVPQLVWEWAQRKSGNQQTWGVSWSDGRSEAEAIVDKLLTNDVLAQAVYKKLHAERMRDTRAESKRRSTG